MNRLSMDHGNCNITLDKIGYDHVFHTLKDHVMDGNVFVSDAMKHCIEFCPFILSVEIEIRIK